MRAIAELQDKNDPYWINGEEDEQYLIKSQEGQEEDQEDWGQEEEIDKLGKV